jgi:hypothetical protein
MRSRNPYRPCRLRAKSAHRRSATVLALAGLMTLLVGPVYATVTPGEQFVYDWTETSGTNPGLSGTVDFTLGPASTMTGFFSVSSFDVTQNGGFCALCSPLSESLSSVLFDAATLGLVGDITGQYLNNKGRTHTYDLVTVDLPTGTWTFADTGPGGATQTSQGTYNISLSTRTTAVDEPATLLLLIPAGVALLISLRRRLGVFPWGASGERTCS